MISARVLISHSFKLTTTQDMKLQKLAVPDGPKPTKLLAHKLHPRKWIMSITPLKGSIEGGKNTLVFTKCALIMWFHWQVKMSPTPSSNFTLQPFEPYSSCLCANGRKTFKWILSASVLGLFWTFFFFFFLPELRWRCSLVCLCRTCQCDSQCSGWTIPGSMWHGVRDCAWERTHWCSHSKSTCSGKC